MALLRRDRALLQSDRALLQRERALLQRDRALFTTVARALLLLSSFGRKICFKKQSS